MGRPCWAASSPAGAPASAAPAKAQAARTKISRRRIDLSSNDKSRSLRPGPRETATSMSQIAASADELIVGEELGDLDLGVVGRVRAVHRVLTHVAGVELADGAFGGVLRVGGANDVAIARHGVVAFQNLHDHGAGGHELHQLAEERALLVDLIELFSLGAAHADAALGDDAQARVLDHGVDLAGQVPLGGVGLDDGEGTFGHSTHESWRSWGRGLIAVRPRIANTAFAPVRLA